MFVTGLSHQTSFFFVIDFGCC